MATLTWGDVVIIGLVATVGFSLLAYWFSGPLAKRNVTGQLKSKMKAAPAAPPKEPDAPKRA